MSTVRVCAYLRFSRTLRLVNTKSIAKLVAACMTRRPIAPEVPDLKALRERLGLTQGQFGNLLGYTSDGVRQWESGRRVPELGTRIMLHLLDTEPETVLRSLYPDV